MNKKYLLYIAVFSLIVGLPLFFIGISFSDQKVTTSDCPDDCVSKECHAYSFWEDDDTYGAEHQHQGFKDGPCTCHYVNSDGTTVTACKNYKKRYTKDHMVFVIIGILGMSLFVLYWLIGQCCSLFPFDEDQQHRPLHSAEDTHVVDDLVCWDEDDKAPKAVEIV